MKAFMIYASTAELKCFECGDIGHRQFACPHKDQVNTMRRTMLIRYMM